MSTRRETLPSTRRSTVRRCPARARSTFPVRGGMRVPFREIALSPTRGLRGEAELNPPFRVYDTSGPYTDPAASIDLRAGLPELRRPWILARGEYDRVVAAPARAPPASA